MIFHKVSKGYQTPVVDKVTNSITHYWLLFLLFVPSYLLVLPRITSHINFFFSGSIIRRSQTKTTRNVTKPILHRIGWEPGGLCCRLSPPFTNFMSGLMTVSVFFSP